MCSVARINVAFTTFRSSSARVRSSRLNPRRRDHRARYGDFGHCACRPASRSIASTGPSPRRRRRNCRSSSARFSSRSVKTRSALAFGFVIRATYERDPPEAAETLALIESVGRADGPEHVRGHVVAREGGRAVLEFSEANWGADVTLLVSSLLAGEWADSSAFRRCRLVEVEWPAGFFPGPAFAAPDSVLVGAIVKPRSVSHRRRLQQRRLSWRREAPTS